MGVPREAYGPNRILWMQKNCECMSHCADKVSLHKFIKVQQNRGVTKDIDIDFRTRYTTLPPSSRMQQTTDQLLAIAWLSWYSFRNDEIFFWWCGVNLQHNCSSQCKQQAECVSDLSCCCTSYLLGQIQCYALFRLKHAASHCHWNVHFWKGCDNKENAKVIKDPQIAHTSGQL